MGGFTSALWVFGLSRARGSIDDQVMLGVKNREKLSTFRVWREKNVCDEVWQLVIDRIFKTDCATNPSLNL